MSSSRPASPDRVGSIDALRGLVMLTMVFVNDLAGAPAALVPEAMRHFHGKSGMTFVDLVFPAFLFVVGLSIPAALGSRLDRGTPAWRLVGHVFARTAWLLALGILMVNGTPDSTRLGWSGTLWCTLMYAAAIVALGDFRSDDPADDSTRRTLVRILRLAGAVVLILLALVYRGPQDERILTLSPLTIRTEWYGILGLIGWSYLIGCVVFLLFRNQQTALLGCMVLLLALYPADQTGLFAGTWLSRYVGIGGMLGAHPSITVAGLLLGSVVTPPDRESGGTPVRFTLLLVLGCAAGAVLLHGLYGINKNLATPSWCLWACAITATLWLALDGLGRLPGLGWLLAPFALAGRNVLLAYLLSEMLPSLREIVGLGNWYGDLATHSLAGAITRSAACALLVGAATVGLNRVGFRVRL